ncbi:MAG: hypothetical protein JXA97_04480 [Anaerolineales bacterium]|nr:hypothetical protein [Anaerolineales bacterium]
MYPNRCKLLVLLVITALLTLSSCNAPARMPDNVTPTIERDVSGGDEPDRPEETPTPRPDDGSGPTVEDPFFEGIERGDFEIVDVVMSEDGIQGRIIDVAVHNPGTETITVLIPCGMFFAPSDDDTQRMMVIQSEEVVIDGGETVVIEPFVICIDGSAGAPSGGDAYQVGMLTSGELLQFAQCLCLIDLDVDTGAAQVPMGGGEFGLQFAVWAVSDDMFGEDTEFDFGESASAIDSIFGAEFGEELGDMAEMINAMLEMYRGMVAPWLAYCGISLEP